MCKNIRPGTVWVVGREDLPRVQGMFPKIFYSEAEDQRQRQMIIYWVGVCEQMIVGSEQAGSNMYENRRPVPDGW